MSQNGRKTHKRMPFSGFSYQAKHHQHHYLVTASCQYLLYARKRCIPLHHENSERHLDLDTNVV